MMLEIAIEHYNEICHRLEVLFYNPSAICWGKYFTVTPSRIFSSVEKTGSCLSFYLGYFRELIAVQ
jgi:hypothetical protein